MRDEQSDACQCIACNPPRSGLRLVSSQEIISIAYGEALRKIWTPHDVPQEIVDAAKRADMRLAELNRGA
jgi:hypothetical protein